MKHYYNPMSRAVTTDWMLKELDAQHEQIIIDFTADENNFPDFREINPMGKLPALVDGGVVVTEVAAICAYLADKFPEKKLAPEIGSCDRRRDEQRNKSFADNHLTNYYGRGTYFAFCQGCFGN